MLSVRYASQFVGVLAKDGRIRNTLFQTEAGVYIKKFLPGTLSGVPRGRKTDFFPHIRVYTEKLSLYIQFFCDQRGMDTQFFCIYPVSLYKPGKKGSLRKSGVLRDQRMIKIG